MSLHKYGRKESQLKRKPRTTFTIYRHQLIHLGQFILRQYAGETGHRCHSWLRDCFFLIVSPHWAVNVLFVSFCTVRFNYRHRHTAVLYIITRFYCDTAHHILYTNSLVSLCSTLVFTLPLGIYGLLT